MYCILNHIKSVVKEKDGWPHAKDKDGRWGMGDGRPEAGGDLCEI